MMSSARLLTFPQPLFIFLTVAVLTGIISGLVLYGMCTFLVDYLPTYLLGSLRIPSLLGGQPGEANYSSKKGYPSASYEEPSVRASDISAKWGDQKDMGPLSSTILEEDESSPGSGGDSLEYDL